MSKNAFIPDGYNAIVPGLAFSNAASAIEWYKTVFGAREKLRLENPDKTIAHAELVIGDCVLMLAEENPGYNRSAKSVGGNSVNLHLYVPDADATIRKAADNKAKVTRPVEEMFYGDRVGRIEDPFGYTWNVATHVRDVPEKELRAKMKEMAAAHA